jgi:hypothetical protein
MVRLVSLLLLLAVSTGAACCAQDAAPLDELLRPPGVFRVGEGAKVGQGVYMRTSQARIPSYDFTIAIVGERAGHWLVESSESARYHAISQPELADVVEGWVVHKQSGRVVAAVAGRAGEALTALEVPAEEEDVSAGEPVGEEVLEYSFGHVKAHKHVRGERTEWVGADGEYAGVLLKVVEKQETTLQLYNQLDEKPARVDRTEPNSVDIRALIYSKSRVFRVTHHPLIRALQPFGRSQWGLYQRTASRYSRRVIGVELEAKPKLDWTAVEIPEEKKGGG